MASNLPTDIEDVRIVLELLRELVEGFLAADEPANEPAKVVTRLKIVD